MKGVQENLVTIVYMIVAEWLPLVALIGVFNSPQINAYGAIRDNDRVRSGKAEPCTLRACGGPDTKLHLLRN